MPDAEARELFSVYDLPTWQKADACGRAEAIQAADAVGYPVFIELASGPGAFDPGGEMCRLKATDAAAVGQAIGTLEFVDRRQFGTEGPTRVIVRRLVPPTAVKVALSSTDHPELGPVVRLGESGSPGEPSRRPFVTLTPITQLTAQEIIQHCPALQVQSNGPLDLDALVGFLRRFGQLVVEQRWIKQVTVNPLLVTADQVMAGDIRITIHDGLEEEPTMTK
jgi:acetyltransferase